MDIRQQPEWGNYLSSIGWTIEKVGKTQIFIRKLPFLPFSVIKIQHPENPLPFLKIDQIAKKYKTLFALIEPETVDFNEENFLKNKYEKSKMTLTHTATIQVNAHQSEEELLASISENARRNIKKAIKNNLRVEIIFLKDQKDDQKFKQFYKLLDSLTKIKKFYTPGYDEFHKKMLAFKKASVLLFAYPPVIATRKLAGKQSQDPIATVWLATFPDKIAYMHTGITKEGYNLMANYLLVWEALKLGKKLKIKNFDFEGIFDPRFPKERKKWKNFSEFKKRFHGTLVQYPQPWIKFYSRSFKLLYLCSKFLSI